MHALKGANTLVEWYAQPVRYNYVDNTVLYVERNGGDWITHQLIAAAASCYTYKKTHNEPVMRSVKNDCLPEML